MVIGRPRGQRKAERKLRRDLANRSAQVALLTEAGSIIRTVAGTAATSPIVGTVLSIATIDLLHRAQLISDGAWLTGFALVGAIDLAAAAQAVGAAVGSAATGIGSIIPSALVPFTSSSKSITIGSQESLIATSPNVSMADSKPKPAGLTKSENSLYLPE